MASKRKRPTLKLNKKLPLTHSPLGGSAPANAPATPPALPASDTQQPHPPTPAPVPTVSLADWHLCADTVVGLAHRRKGLPCQDAAAFRRQPRPILVLSDGAGSAAISEQGAQAMVTGTLRLLRTLEDTLATWLDQDVAPSPEHSACWSQRLHLHALGLLTDLAHQQRRQVCDLRGTLLVVIIGSRHSYWLKIGDGAIVIQSHQSLHALGHPMQAKGEFANQTCFVDTATINDLQYGLLCSQEITGVALMSDGGAEKLVAHDGSKVAPRLGLWLDEVAKQTFTVDKIALAFHEPAMWERTSLDDRAIVLAARPGATVPQTPQPRPPETTDTPNPSTAAPVPLAPAPDAARPH